KRNFACGGVAALIALASLVSSYSKEPAVTTAGDAAVPRGKIISLFDGKTLDGWIQEPAGPTSLSTGDISDYAAFAKKLQDTTNPLSAALFARLDDAGRSSLAQLDTTDAATLKAAKSALVKSLNKIISGPTVYDAAAFKA